MRAWVMMKDIWVMIKEMNFARGSVPHRSVPEQAPSPQAHLVRIYQDSTMLAEGTTSCSHHHYSASTPEASFFFRWICKGNLPWWLFLCHYRKKTPPEQKQDHRNDEGRDRKARGRFPCKEPAKQPPHRPGAYPGQRRAPKRRAPA